MVAIDPRPFADAKPLLFNGDVLLFRSRSLVGRIIGTAGRGKYSHAGMVGWWDNGQPEPMCLEVREMLGGRAVLLESQVQQYPGAIDVYRADIRDDQRDAVVVAMRQKTGKAYNYRGILLAALLHLPFLRWFVTPNTHDDEDTEPNAPEFCSQAVASAYRKGAGVDLVPNAADRITEPSDLGRGRLNYLLTLAVLLAGFAYLSPPAHGQLMAPERAATLRSYFPRVDDAKIQSVLDSKDLLLYTDAEIEPAYQFLDGVPSMAGVHAVSYNISAEPSEPFGNGNREFPWGTPAGLHKSRHSVFRFLLLPVRSGVRLPVVWFRRHFRGDHRPAVCWIFPVGTVVGECLIQTGPDGRGYAFEVRTRTRERGQWAVDAFRPFPTPESLAERLKELGYQQPVAFGRPVLRTLVDRHPKQSFKSVALVEELPSLPPALVAKLLTTTPFKSALGTAWRETDEHVAAAPTTSQPFHIVPANYEAGFIQVDRNSCTRCHENTMDHVDLFDAGRDWYGRVRGSDGIFSFHPFSPASISHNGSGMPIRINSRLVEAGVVAEYDAGKHPAHLYHEIEK